MIIDRFRWSDALAFLTLSICATICLGEKELVQDNPDSTKLDARQAETSVDPDPDSIDDPEDRPSKPRRKLPNQDVSDLDSKPSDRVKPSSSPDATGGPTLAPDNDAAIAKLLKEIERLQSMIKDSRADVDARKRDAELKEYGNMLKAAQQALAQRTKRIDRLTLDQPAADVPGTGQPGSAPSHRIEGGDLLLVETNDGLSGFSKSLGKWDRVVVGHPKNGQSRLNKAMVSQNFASVVIDDQLFGFCSKSGRWGQLKIPDQFVGKIAPRLGNNLLTVELGDETFALSPATGEWISSAGSRSHFENPDDRLPRVKRDSAITPSESLPSIDSLGEEIDLAAGSVTGKKRARALNAAGSPSLTSKIAALDARAMVLGSQIRTLIKAGRGEKESSELLELRKELDATLDTTFDLKNEQERLRVKELQLRLRQLEKQIGRREALRSKIVERRTRELIDGDETKWNEQSAAVIKRDAANPAQDVQTSPSGAAKIKSDSDSSPPSLGFLGPQQGASVAADASSSKRSQNDRLEDEKPPLQIVPDVSTEEGKFPSYKSIATGILNAMEELETAKSGFGYTERLVKQHVVSNDELEGFKRKLDFAQRRLKVLQDDYRATLHDLELQLNAAIAEYDSASKEMERLHRLEPGVISVQAMRESQRRLDLAKTPIERLRARYKLYRQAGEILGDKYQSHEPTLNVDSFDVPSWGLRLAKAPVNELDHAGDKKFRTGLRIVDVAPGSAAAKMSVQKDDILVGLDDSPITGYEQFVTFLERLEQQAAKTDGNQDVTICVIRGNSTLQFPLPIVPKPNEKPNQN